MRIVLRNLWYAREVGLGVEVFAIDKTQVANTDIITLLVVSTQRLIIDLVEESIRLLEIGVVALIRSNQKGHIVAMEALRVATQVLLHHTEFVAHAEFHGTAHLMVLHPLHFSTLGHGIQLSTKAFQLYTRLAPATTLKHTLYVVEALNLIRNLCISTTREQD